MPSPHTAATPAYDPYCPTLSWREGAGASAGMKESMLGSGPDGGGPARIGAHGRLGRERAHARGEPGRVALQDEQRDLVEHRLDGGGVEPLALGQHDLLRGCRLGALVGVEQVLVELLPRAPSHLLDRDVDVR